MVASASEVACANPECDVRFTPRRVDQKFHDAGCRKAYWKKAYHWSAHPCPLCTLIHDPDEPAVLDALERLLRDAESCGLLKKSEVVDFIARRRAILNPA